jgi:glycosyltransferase involved in cell wall biosynthesis
LGWEATIIAASVEHGTGRQRLLSSELSRLESDGGIPFLWVNTPGYVGNGSGRIRNMLAFTRSVLKRKSTSSLPRPDVVIGSSVHPFAALAGALLARRFKVPFVLEIRDLWPQTLIDMGRLREKSLLAYLLRRLELWLYRRASKIIVLLPRAWEYIVPLGISKDRVVWIPNGVDLGLFPASSAPQASEAFTLMYFGAHGQANGLDVVLKAMHQLQQMPEAKNIRLRLIGDGPLKPRLIDMAEQLELSNVSFEPAVAKSQIPRLASQADAFVIAVLDLPGLYKYGISMNKLFDYMAAMRPVIMASAAANNPIAEANAGLSVKPGDPLALAGAIVQMACLSSEERQQMGNAGRRYVEQNHSFQILAKRLADVLNAETA